MLKNTIHMYVYAFQVVDIDPDVQRLQLAREKYSVHNVVFQEGVAEHIPGSNFDVVFSNAVLHWCEDKDRVFKEVAKSLKKGGKFGYVTPTNFSVEREFCTPADMFSAECREYMIEIIHVPTSDELHSLASDNGFVTLYSKETIREYRFNNVYKLIEFYMTHMHKYSDEHYITEAMKRHYGEEEIVFMMPCTTAVLSFNG